ncbi:hypothetical protein [Streptomyces sp. NPDC056669]|uniref:hypothetical protein n=1 Tax=Streptomyces sp. NPDC056669 TaxID=3345903 RepID=UPI0036AC786E
MGSGTTTRPGRRTWTVEIHMHPWERTLLCDRCGPVPITAGPPGVRARAVSHLADHAHAEALAHHLRTCQCGDGTCQWHPRHRGCDGPLVLLLARDDSGHLWRLADTCRACAAATAHAAVVTESRRFPALLRSQQLLSPPGSTAAAGDREASAPLTPESFPCALAFEEDNVVWTDPSAYD